MKKTSIALLSIFALYAAQGHAAHNSWSARSKKKSSSCPSSSGWNFTSDCDLGVMDYLVLGGKQITGDSEFTQVNIAGPKLSLGQNVRYGSWFDFRVRIAGGLGLTASEPGLQEKSYLLSADAQLFFPFCIHKTANLTLLPTVGWGFNQFYSPQFLDLEDDVTSSYRNRSFAPLLGVYLKLSPADNFSVKGGCSLHFPTFKQEIIRSNFEASGTDHLNSRRHGVSSELEVSYVLDKMTSLTSKFEYVSLGASKGSNSNVFSRQLSWMIGARFSY